MNTKKRSLLAQLHNLSDELQPAQIKNLLIEQQDIFQHVDTKLSNILQETLP
jgi:hypothetical protein